MIIPVNGGKPGLLEKLRQIREAGDVPLVGDARWSKTHRDAMVAAANQAELPDGTAWATLTSGSSGAPRIVLPSHEPCSIFCARRQRGFPTLRRSTTATAHSVIESSPRG